MSANFESSTQVEIEIVISTQDLDVKQLNDEINYSRHNEVKIVEKTIMFLKSNFHTNGDRVVSNGELSMEEIVRLYETHVGKK